MPPIVRNLFCISLIFLSGCAVQKALTGEYYLTGPDFETGIKKFTAAVQREPENARNHYYLGRLYLSQGNALQGQKHLARAVELAPAKADFHFWLGVAYAAMRRAELERRSYLKTLELDPNHVQALAYLGHNQMARNKLTEALVSYNRALAVQHDIPQALYNRGLIFQRLNRTPEETAAWKEYLRHYPHGALARKAVAHLNAGGDFQYRNHHIGKRLIPLASIAFEPFSATLTKTSKRALNYLGKAIMDYPNLQLRIVAYQQNNLQLARQRAHSVQTYLTTTTPALDAARIAANWFDVPETVQAGGNRFELHESVFFFTKLKPNDPQKKNTNGKTDRKTY